MKFKSEYRWLMFILIPFVVLLVIHITNPLMLLLNSHPVAISSYSAHNLDLLSAASRSYLALESHELATILKMYASFSDMVGSMMLKGSRFANKETSEINNAN